MSDIRTWPAYRRTRSAIRAARHMPTVTQIAAASIQLRHAANLSIVVEAVSLYAAEEKVDVYRRHMVDALRSAAGALGYELKLIEKARGPQQ